MRSSHTPAKRPSSYSYLGHYHTAGWGLITVGGINFVISAIAALQNQTNAFISYETMFTFAVMMIALGGWMTSLQDD